MRKRRAASVGSTASASEKELAKLKKATFALMCQDRQRLLVRFPFTGGILMRMEFVPSSASGEASPIPKMRLLAHCIQWPAFGRAVRRHHNERNRHMKKPPESGAIDIAAVQSRMLTGDKLEVKIFDLQSAFRGTISH